MREPGGVPKELRTGFPLRRVRVQIVRYHRGRERGRETREQDRQQRCRRHAIVKDEDRLEQPAWDRFERHFEKLANEHLGERIDRSAGNVALATCDAESVHSGLAKREHQEDLLHDGDWTKMSVLNDDDKDLKSKGRQEHCEQCVSTCALPIAEHGHEVDDI
jgi:hypothetical protein